MKAWFKAWLHRQYWGEPIKTAPPPGPYWLDDPNLSDKEKDAIIRDPELTAAAHDAWIERCRANAAWKDD